VQLNVALAAIFLSTVEQFYGSLMGQLRAG